MQTLEATLAAALVLGVHGTAASAQHPAPFEPQVAPASGEAAAALSRLALAPGIAATLFAAEPLLANPVALHVNARGELYVAESFRLHAGVTDLREHLERRAQQPAQRSLEDRGAML